MVVPTLSISPFSACLTPQNSLAAATHKVGVRPPRPHTTSHASLSSSFLGPNAKTKASSTKASTAAATACSQPTLWNDLRELGHDVKDGVLGLREVWMESSKSKGQCSTFMDDLAEFVDPNFLIDPESAKGAGEGKAKFFTFDKMERLLNYCVPLAVDPRSPNSRARDAAVAEEEGREDLVAVSSEKSAREEDEEAASADPGSDSSGARASQQQQQQQQLANRSNDTFDAFSGGLLEHTNRIREKMMERSRNRGSGASTAPARVLRSAGGAETNAGSSSSSEEGPRTASGGEKMRDNPVVVPGGLWSLPSNEERYGASLSQSFTASRSTRSSGTTTEERGRSSNAYYSGPDMVDDVLMMRSMSTEDKSYDDSQPSRVSAPASGVSEDNEYYVKVIEAAFQEASNSLERVGGELERKQRKLKLNIELGREDEDEVVNAAISAMVGLTSPRSLDSDDKYGMMDEEPAEEEENVAAFDPYADTHELSHYRRTRQIAPMSYEAPPQDDSRDEEPVRLRELDEDNEAVNRHFDSIMSDFEFALDREEKKESKTVYEKLRKYQMQKNFVKHSRKSGVKSPVYPRHEEDDTASKASHLSNHSTTASFLQSTTMGRKLNRSAPPSPGSLAGSVAGSREGLLDRARQAVTRVNQVIESISDEEEVKVEKRDVHESHADHGRSLHHPSPVASTKTVGPSARSNIPERPRQQITDPTPKPVARPSPVETSISNAKEDESTPVAQYKKRLLEQRSRRMQRDLELSSRESDNVSSGRSFENTDKPMLPELGAQLQESNQQPSSVNAPNLDTLIQAASQDEANLGICSSGVDSFDSSVNWDALAYSMSESMSVNDHGSNHNEVSSTIDHLSPVNEQPRPSYDLSEKGYQQSVFKVPSPADHTAVLGRMEEIKKCHNEEMNKSPRVASQPEADAPHDECYDGTMVNPASEEENQPLSPNSITPTPESNIQKRIELMKQQVEKNADYMLKDLDNDEVHINECVGLWKLNSKKFEKAKAITPASTRQSANSFNFDRSPRNATSTEDLMLRNLELEQEMNQIRALSPLSTHSKKYPSGDHQGSSPLASPLSRMGSPRSYADSISKSKNYTSSYTRESERKYSLKVEIPDSPKSPSDWSLSRSNLNPREERVRTRVSDLMEEVKGFLAENDRARERIARDMDALQAMHNF